MGSDVTPRRVDPTTRRSPAEGQVFRFIIDPGAFRSFPVGNARTIYVLTRGGSMDVANAEAASTLQLGKTGPEIPLLGISWVLRVPEGISDLTLRRAATADQWQATVVTSPDPDFDLHTDATGGGGPITGSVTIDGQPIDVNVVSSDVPAADDATLRRLIEEILALLRAATGVEPLISPASSFSPQIKWVELNATESGDNDVIPAAPGVVFKVVGIDMVASAAVDVSWKSGANIVRNAQSFAANGGLVFGGPGIFVQTARGEGLVCTLGVAANVRGALRYIEE